MNNSSRTHKWILRTTDNCTYSNMTWIILVNLGFKKKHELDRCLNPCKHVHNLTASCSLIQKVTVLCLWSFTISNYEWNLSVHSTRPTLQYAFAFAKLKDLYVWGTWSVMRDCRCMAARVRVNACIYVCLSRDNDVVGGNNVYSP